MRADFGHPNGIIRLWNGAVSARIDLRVFGVSIIVLLLAISIALITLASGEFQVSLTDVAKALVGQSDPKTHMVVVEWRLPRTSLALIMGAALGMSGAIFQSITRNPLGSPDVIGFDAGAYAGALVVIILLHGSFYGVAAGAVIGGIVSAIVVYALAWRGGVQGFRLIVVGIGVSAMLMAVNSYLMIKASLQVAMAAAVWGAGSLNGMTLERLAQVAIVLTIVAPLALLLGRPLRQLELGDDAARSLGVNAERTRLAMTVLGVALSAIVTAAAGPITFVALAAPQIARRLCGTAGVALLPSAATGALLLTGADYLAQRAFAPTQLPVGIVTVCIGGLYFAWLLVQEARR